jgi:hypothetical protein
VLLDRAKLPQQRSRSSNVKRDGSLKTPLNLNGTRPTPNSQIFRKGLEEGAAWLVEKETLLEDELPKPDLSKLESAKKPQRINWWLVIVGPQKAQR